MIIPRVGDYWEFRPSRIGKHKTRKFIKEIIWLYAQTLGKRLPYIVWSHRPKARYIGDLRVKALLGTRCGHLIKRTSNEE